MLAATQVHAAEIVTRGVGSAPTKGQKPQAVRAIATENAKRQAVIAAIDKVLGADASARPEVASKVPAIVEQVGDDKIVDSEGSTVNGVYQVSLSISLDDNWFRTALTDAHLALNETAVRSHSLLAVVDEYVTTSRAWDKPLRDVVEYSRQAGDSFSDTSRAGASEHSASSRHAQLAVDKASSSASFDAAKGKWDNSLSASEREDASFKGGAHAAESARLADADGSGSASRAAGFSASGASSSSASLNSRDSGQFAVAHADAANSKTTIRAGSGASSSSSASAFDNHNVHAEDHDNVSYRHVIEYPQPTEKPESTGQTYNALKGQLQAYDLNVKDNDLFRSRYFQDRPLTMQQMQGGGELSRYVDYARQEGADFFMAGVVVIVDEGRNPATGEETCHGVLTFKTYSTVNAEDIASGAAPAEAAGPTIEACASNAAKKMAAEGGEVLGARVQTYWKNRSMYGRQVTLVLRGSSLPLMTRSYFMKAVKALNGVENVTERRADASAMEMVVSYKGGDIDLALADALQGVPAFANLDSKPDGDKVLLCLGPCSSLQP